MRGSAVLLVAAAALGAVCAPAAEPLWAGSWVLVPARSTFRSGPAKSAATLVFLNDGGWDESWTGVSNDRGTSRARGKVLTLNGEVVDEAEVSVTPDDRHAFDHQIRFKGEVVWKGRGEASPDGQTLTYTSTGVDEHGTKVDRVEVYVRQAPVGGDLWVGTWTLVPERSSYRAGMSKKSATLVLANDGGWQITWVNSRDETGSSKGSGGKISMATQPVDDLALTVRPIDSRTIEHQVRFRGQVVWTARGVVAADGRTFTYETKGVSPQGDSIERTEVFERRQ